MQEQAAPIVRRNGLRGFPVHHPLQCRLGLLHRIGGALGGAGRKGLGMIGQQVPHADPVERVIAVTRIVHRRQSGRATDRDQLHLFEGEQWAQDGSIAPADASQAGQATAARQPHQQGFQLIVRMMGGRDEGQGLRVGPVFEQAIAHFARGGLHIAGDRLVGRQDVMRDRPAGADARHKGSLRRRFGPQAMIDSGRSNPARHGLLRQEQQRQTVRPAGHGQPQARHRCASRPFQPAAKARNGVLGGQITCNWPSPGRT